MDFFEYSMAGITASSSCGDLAEPLNLNDYDLLILTSSWDDRCLSLRRTLISPVQNTIVLLFDDKDINGKREANDKEVLAFASSISSNVCQVNGESTNIHGVWKELFATVTRAAIEAGHPLSILFDLSTSPRYYALSLLAASFKFGLASDVDYFYNECTYPDKADTDANIEIDFTAGRWTPVPVANTHGDTQSDLKNRFTVSLGFEGSKTLMALNEYEPDQVSVIIPDPGFAENYVDRVISANEELFRNFGVSENNEIHSQAGNAVDVWKKTLAMCKQGGKRGWNEYFLCAGSKPHSLGLALAAITLKYPHLLYSLPEKHVPINVIPSDKYWLHKVTSHIVPRNKNV